MTTKQPPIEVLSGSELDGPCEDIAEWSGLVIPDAKADDYADLVAGVRAIGELFDSVEPSAFEVVQADEDLGPGMNDTIWTVTSSSPDALLAKVRKWLATELKIAVPRSKR